MALGVQTQNTSLVASGWIVFEAIAACNHRRF